MLKPIETRYAGCLFRSRLEARWGVFYDSLEIRWEYEKEGFDLGDGKWYLPDFWLPQQRCWVEVKGEKPTEYETQLAQELATMTQFPVYVFFGDIPRIDEVDCGGPEYTEHGWMSAIFYPPDGGGDYHYCWTECHYCGSLGIAFDARSNRLPCKVGRSTIGACPREGYHEDKGYNGNSPRLLLAYAAARSARFEHGT